MIPLNRGPDRRHSSMTIEEERQVLLQQFIQAVQGGVSCFFIKAYQRIRFRSETLTESEFTEDVLKSEGGSRRNPGNERIRMSDFLIAWQVVYD